MTARNKISVRDQLMSVVRTARCSIAVLDTLDTLESTREIFAGYPEHKELMFMRAEIRKALIRLEARAYDVAEGCR